MPAQRLSMRPVREVLRLKWACGLSDRKMAQSVRVSRPTVAEYVRRAQAAGLAWPLRTPSTSGPWHDDALPQPRKPGGEAPHPGLDHCAPGAHTSRGHLRPALAGLQGDHP